MSLLVLLVVIALCGVAAWWLQRSPIIAEPFKSVLVWVLIGIVVVVVLKALGVWAWLLSIRV